MDILQDGLGFNVTTRTIKLLEENRGKLNDTGHGSDSIISLKPPGIKTNNSQRGSHPI